VEDSLALFGSKMVMQYGFAGFSVILLSMLFWLIRILITLLKENTKIIGENTATIAKVGETTGELKGLMIEVKDELLSRPCLMKKRD
jgi:hypothetical protein